MAMAIDFMVKVYDGESYFTSKVYAINVERNQFLISGKEEKFYWVNMEDCLLHVSHEED